MLFSMRIMSALQNRSLRAMEKIIVEMGNKTAVLCTHSVLMAVILKQYNRTFGFENFMRIAQEEPCIIKLEINNSGCASVEKVKFP